MKRIQLWHHSGGGGWEKLAMTRAALHLITGQSIDAVIEFDELGFSVDEMPQHWGHAGAQRYREALAHDPRAAGTGFIGVIRYWAEQLGTIEIEQDGDSRTAWLVVPDVDA